MKLPEPVCILGLGREGMSTYRFLRASNPTMKLLCADIHPRNKLDADWVRMTAQDVNTTFMTGSTYLEALSASATIVRSPGISPFIPEVQAARKAGIIFTSQTQLFLEQYRDKVIGVTGTKGKSTTASLIAHILQTANIPAQLLGNIGIPPLDAVADKQPTWFVLELSAHQLYDVTISPHIAVILDITQEHLDYYPDRVTYIAAKGSMTRYQMNDDHVIYSRSSDTVLRLVHNSHAHRHLWSWGPATDAAIWEDDQRIVLHGEHLIAIHEIPLLGHFNLANVMSAAMAASLVGVPSTIIAQAIRSFQPLPVRLEKVGTYNGITFYDDSLATTPEATIAALDALDTPDQNASAVGSIILGGHERNADFHSLAERLTKSSVKTIILLPTVGKRIEQTLLSNEPDFATTHTVIHADTMDAAVQACFEHTPPNSICLLYTAAPSFSMFKDYQEKSKAFRDAILNYRNPSQRRINQ